VGREEIKEKGERSKWKQRAPRSSLHNASASRQQRGGRHVYLERRCAAEERGCVDEEEEEEGREGRRLACALDGAMIGLACGVCDFSFSVRHLSSSHHCISHVYTALTTPSLPPFLPPSLPPLLTDRRPLQRVQHHPVHAHRRQGQVDRRLLLPQEARELRRGGRHEGGREGGREGGYIDAWRMTTAAPCGLRGGKKR